MARVKTKHVLVGVVAAVLLLVGGFVGVKRYGEYKRRTNPSAPSKTVPVSTYTVAAKELDCTVEALANVESMRRYFVYFKTSGRVRQVKKRSDGMPIMPGDAVKKGDVLAEMEDEVEQAQLKVRQCEVTSSDAQLRAAVTQAEGDKKQVAFADRRYKRYKTMLAKSAVSQQDLDDAERDLRKYETSHANSVAYIDVAKAQLEEKKAQLNLAKEQLNYTKLIAPMAGVIAYQNIREGDYFSDQSMVRFTDDQQLLNTCPIVLIDPVELWAKAALLPEDAGRLKPGGRVEIFDDAHDNVRLGEGKVVAIQPARQIRTRMVEVRVRITKREKQLVHGTLAKCRFDLGSEKVVVVPRDALVMRESRYLVFECLPSGEVKQREVKVGRTFPEGFEVLGGIKEGARIAARGRYRLRDGHKVDVLKDPQ